MATDVTEPRPVSHTPLRGGRPTLGLIAGCHAHGAARFVCSVTAPHTICFRKHEGRSVNTDTAPPEPRGPGWQDRRRLSGLSPSVTADHLDRLLFPEAAMWQQLASLPHRPTVRRLWQSSTPSRWTVTLSGLSTPVTPWPRSTHARAVLDW